MKGRKRLAKPRLLAGTAVLLAGTWAPSVAALENLGQSPADVSQAASEDSVQPEDQAGQRVSSGAGIDEIIVTAQRREQSIQDVGISITALSSEELSRNVVSNATDITNVVPNLRFITLGGAVVNFNIRGISQNDYADHLEPPVAVYVDDAYLSTTTQASLPIFDVERVEVLRGPQGTLFGRNATGGLIHFISKQPTDYFDGYLEATLADDVWGKVEGAVGGPLADNLQARLSFSVSSREGYVKNAFDDTKLGSEHYAAARAIFAYQPNESLDVNLSLRYARNFDQTGAPYTFAPTIAGPDGLGRFVGPDENPYGTCNGCGPAYYEGYTQDDPYEGSFTNRGNYARSAYGVTLKLEQDLDFATLISITDYQRLEKTYYEDVDAAPQYIADDYHTQELDHLTQEVRLVGDAPGFDWTAGVYLFYQNSDTLTTYVLFDGGGPLPKNYAEMKTYSAAAYGQGDIALGDQINLILGGRYTYDHKKDSYLATDANFAGPPLDFNPDTYPELADRKFDLFSAKAELQWRPADRLMLYGSVNRGTKGGGFSTPGYLPIDPETIPFDDETLYAYEIGEKWTSADGSIRLNAAVFHYDYRDYQAFSFRTLNGNPVGTIVNRDAEVWGVEADLTVWPMEGLMLNIAPSYLDTKVKNVQLPSGRIVDRPLPQAPEWSGSAKVRYEWNAFADKTAAVQFDVTYNDDQNFTVLAAFDEREGAYAFGNLRMSLAQDDVWEAALFVKNIWNEEYRNFAFDLSSLGTIAQSYVRPRTVGLQFRYNFE